MTSSMSFERASNSIVTEAEGIRSLADGAPADVPIPSCPEWTLGDLVRHVTGVHRWVERIVRSRASAPVPDDEVNDVFAMGHDDREVATDELVSGAVRLAETLGATEGGVPVWSPGPEQSCAFWARRALHETLLHRADVALALGSTFTVVDEVAADALDEWMDNASVPEPYRSVSGRRSLLAPGHAVHLQATDAGAGVASDWLMDLTGDAPRWSHDRASAAAVRARDRLRDLVLFVYGRPTDGVEVAGDAELLELWRERTGFWLRE